MSSTPDAEVSLDDLARAAVSDEAAFDRLARRCHATIYRWAYVATGDADDADDVVQETLLRLHRSLGDFRGDSRFTTWAYRITRSVATDMARSRAGRLRRKLRMFIQRDPHHHTSPDVTDLMEQRRKIALIHAFWEELPPGQRQVFDLADLQDHSPAEIAEMLEMNPNTVRAHLFKARRTIRSRMLSTAPEDANEEAG